MLIHQDFSSCGHKSAAKTVRIDIMVIDGFYRSKLGGEIICWHAKESHHFCDCQIRRSRLFCNFGSLTTLCQSLLSLPPKCPTPPNLNYLTSLAPHKPSHPPAAQRSTATTLTGRDGRTGPTRFSTASMTPPCKNTYDSTTTSTKKRTSNAAKRTGTGF